MVPAGDTRDGELVDLTPGDYDAPSLARAGAEPVAFAPDGRELAYVQNRDKQTALSTNNDVMALPLGPDYTPLGAPRNLTEGNPATDIAPRYSPDGRYLAYLAQRRPGFESDRFEIWLRDRDFRVTENRLAHGGRYIGLQTPGARYTDLLLSLHGAHQADNAAIALAAAECFLGPIDEKVVHNAFARVESPGRLELVHREPLVVLDGAHNVAGAEALRAALDDEFPPAARTFVIGLSFMAAIAVDFYPGFFGKLPAGMSTIFGSSLVLGTLVALTLNLIFRLGMRRTERFTVESTQLDPVAVEAVAIFCALLGTVAGNLALTAGSRGGVFIAGGIVPKMGTLFDRSDFRERFVAKGRMRTFLEPIPTYVITEPYPAFLGLAELLRES